MLYPTRIRAFWFHWWCILLCVVQSKIENHKEDPSYTQFLKKQDKGSITVGFFLFLRWRNCKVSYWQILCYHNKKNSVIALFLSLNSHIHLIIYISLPPHPTYTPGLNNSKNITLKCIIMRFIITFKGTFIWLYLISTLEK